MDGQDKEKKTQDAPVVTGPRPLTPAQVKELDKALSGTAERKAFRLKYGIKDDTNKEK